MRKQELQKEIEELQKQLEEKQKALAAMPDKWHPKGGDFYVDECGHVSEVVSDLLGDSSFGNQYGTELQAEKAAKSMRAHNRLLAYVAEFAPDYEPDWSDIDLPKSTVVFNVVLGRWVTEKNFNLMVQSVAYMPESVAIELCRKLNSGEVEL